MDGAANSDDPEPTVAVADPDTPPGSMPRSEPSEATPNGVYNSFIWVTAL